MAASGARALILDQEDLRTTASSLCALFSMVNCWRASLILLSWDVRLTTLRQIDAAIAVAITVFHISVLHQFDFN
jgi:hypothetical protein